MSNQSIGTTYEDGKGLARLDKKAGRKPRYTASPYTKAGRAAPHDSPFRAGYLSLVDGKEWA